MDPDQLLAQAQRALAAGADSTAINERIASLTNGRYNSLDALANRSQGRAVVNEDVQPATSTPLSRLSARGGSALGDFARMLAQGATFGFADELAGAGAALVPGGKGYTEARDESRQRVADLRELNPGASAVANVAGAVPAALLPLGAAQGAVRAGGGLMGAIGRGTAVGAAEGALLGAGEAEGSPMQRAGQAVPEAAAGAALGGAIGAAPAFLNALRRMRSGRGTRIAGALEESTGVSKSYKQAQAKLTEQKNKISETMFQPLEDTGSEAIEEAVTNPDSPLLDLLRSPDVEKEVRAISREVADGKRAPTFREIQRLRQRMQRINKQPDARLVEQVDELDAILRDVVPGYSEANDAWRLVEAQDRALDAGRKAGKSRTLSADDIELQQAGLSPEELTNYRRGQVHEVARRVLRRESDAMSMMRDIVDAGPEMERVLRSMFPDDATFQGFMQTIRKEQSADAVASAVSKYGKWLAGAGVAGAGLGGANALLN